MNGTLSVRSDIFIHQCRCESSCSESESTRILNSLGTYGISGVLTLSCEGGGSCECYLTRIARDSPDSGCDCTGVTINPV